MRERGRDRVVDYWWAPKTQEEHLKIQERVNHSASFSAVLFIPQDLHFPACTGVGRSGGRGSLVDAFLTCSKEKEKTDSTTTCVERLRGKEGMWVGEGGGQGRKRGGKGGGSRQEVAGNLGQD